MEKTQTQKHTFDAAGKSLGRLATDIARVLMGKDSPTYERHTVADVQVEVLNVDRLHIPMRKQESKTYTRYTEYPGGLRKMTGRQLIEKKGYGELLRKAVYGMLPGNKLRNEMMKRLTIKEADA